MTGEHSYDPADGFPRIMPSLRYQDVGSALDWLGEAFGLREYLRWSSADGLVHHAEMRIANGFVELASATEEQPSPRTLGRVSSSLVVLVDDVDSHHERAQAAGARIIAPLEDKPWGLRQYTAEDLEGHRWEFSQQVRRVDPSEWGAQLAAGRSWPADDRPTGTRDVHSAQSDTLRESIPTLTQYASAALSWIRSDGTVSHPRPIGRSLPM